MKLLKEKPVNRITVKEVCALAQLNRATFYAHYSDCFALMESIENELIDAFEESLRYVNSFDVTALIEAIYDMVDQNQAACRVLILGEYKLHGSHADDCLAKKGSIAYWRKELPGASETELEMMYTHLSNGLMHVVVEGYDKYSKEEMIRFVSRVVKASLSLFQSPQRPLLSIDFMPEWYNRLCKRMDGQRKDGAAYESISADHAGNMCYSYRFRIRGLRRGFGFAG